MTERFGPTQELTLIYMADNSLTDSTGVPKESNRDPMARGIDFKLQPCPFSSSPSRYPNGVPHEIPVSGLERDRLAQNYYEILGSLDYVRAYYLEETRDGEDRSNPLTAYDAREILMALNYSPHFLVYRSNEPLKALGELPVDIIVGANAAAGALAALGTYILNHGLNNDLIYTEIPDPDKMLSESEESGHMVGKKTVCAASSETMLHYFKSLINGPKKTNAGSLEKYVGSDEMLAFMQFGKAMYEGVGELQRLQDLDREIMGGLNDANAKGDSSRFNDLKSSYLVHVANITSGLYADQVASNHALGRNAEVQEEVHLDDLTRTFKLQTASELLKQPRANKQKRLTGISTSQRKKRYLR